MCRLNKISNGCGKATEWWIEVQLPGEKEKRSYTHITRREKEENRKRKRENE